MAYGLKASSCDPLNKKFPNGKHFPLYFQLFKYTHIFLWKYDMGVSIFECYFGMMHTVLIPVILMFWHSMVK